MTKCGMGTLYKSLLCFVLACAKLVLASKSLHVMCFFVILYLFLCGYFCNPQLKTLLINHEAFRLGLQKKRQVNARVTNAVERAEEGEKILFFLSVLQYSLYLLRKPFLCLYLPFHFLSRPFRQTTTDHTMG